VSQAEVEWDDATRTHALAFIRYQNSLCPVCGGPAAECQDGDNENKFDAGLPFRCHRATAVIEARKRMGDDVPAPEALRFVPTLRKGVR
jgi:hypothetical protein